MPRSSNTILHDVAALVVATNRDGRVLLFNRSCERATGYLAGEVQGRLIWELPFVGPGDAGRLQREWDDVVATGVARERETEWFTKAGERRSILWRTSVVRIENGSDDYVVATGLDVTERRDAEDRLRESEGRFRRTFESAPVGIALLSLRGEFLTVNARYCEIVGYPAEDLSRLAIGDLTHVDDHPADHSQRMRALAGEIEGYSIEKRYVRPDGSVVWGHLTLSAVRDRGERRFFVGVLQDITARKVAEEELKRTEVENRRLQEKLLHGQKMESLGRLAGAVAHDFNNLLTVIMTNATLARDACPAAKTVLDDVLLAAKSGAALARQLLAFSRKQVVQPQVLDLAIEIRRVQTLLQRLLGESVTLDVSSGAESPIRMDPGQLEQILVNLALNARDAMPEGGLLRIETRDVATPGWTTSQRPTDERWVEIAVSDTGIGMAPEVQERAFEPFFTTKPAGEGTGLGLATVYGAVSQNKGHILVRSVPGEGTRFKLFFPAVHSDDARADAGRENAASRPCGVARILLVDDEELVRVAVARSLARLGYEVVTFASAAEALASVRSGTAADLLITDVRMPGMNGCELACAVRKLHPQLGVLLISGYAGDVGGEPLSRPPDSEFLAKPFTPAELAERVQALLSARPPT